MDHFPRESGADENYHTSTAETETQIATRQTTDSLDLEKSF